MSDRFVLKKPSALIVIDFECNRKMLFALILVVTAKRRDQKIRSGRLHLLQSKEKDVEVINTEAIRSIVPGSNAAPNPVAPKQKPTWKSSREERIKRKAIADANSKNKRSPDLVRKVSEAESILRNAIQAFASPNEITAAINNGMKDMNFDENVADDDMHSLLRNVARISTYLKLAVQMADDLENSDE